MFLLFIRSALLFFMYLAVVVILRDSRLGFILCFPSVIDILLSSVARNSIHV